MKNMSFSFEDDVPASPVLSCEGTGKVYAFMLGEGYIEMHWPCGSQGFQEQG